MDEIITIGIDLAKNVFQVHAIDASGKVIVQRVDSRKGYKPRFVPCSART